MAIDKPKPKCPHKYPSLPIALTGGNAGKFRCELCGEIGNPFEVPPDPDASKPPYGRCNYCGGKLEDITDEKTNQPSYRCTRCGAQPKTVYDPPRQSRLARSYIPRVGKVET